jgi:DNA mismatch repair protein PMS2
MSKNTVFSEKDFYELVDRIKDNLDSLKVSTASEQLIHKQMRPKKVYHMLASRACRKSIMIGDTLSFKQMNEVVRNLTTLQAPWNCPHGRPTMRHLG